MEFLVTSLEEVRHRVTLWKPTHVVSLLDAQLRTELDFTETADHYKAFFDDVENRQYLSAPKLEHIQTLLQFTQIFPKEARVIVHCHAGISRSTAVTLGVMTQHGTPELDALEHLLDIRPAAAPNLLILEYIDTVLNTGLRPMMEGWNEFANEWWFEMFEAQMSKSTERLRRLKAKQFEFFQKFRQEIENKQQI